MGVADTSVKFFYNGMQGFPSLSTSPGGLIDKLDAALVDGFNTLTLDSLIVASNIATGKRSAGHGYVVGQVIQIAGATPSALNGQWRIYWIDSDEFRFETAGIADQTATGTITAKVAPLGWTKPYSATNISVYRNHRPGGYYRFNDTPSDPRTLSLLCYDEMTDVSTGTGGWLSVSSMVRPDSYFLLIGDSKTFYLFVRDGTYARAHSYAFGDFYSFLPGDAYNELGEGGANGPVIGVFSSTGLTGTRGLRRAWSGVGSPTCYGVRQINDHSGYGGPSFPSPVDNGFLVTDALIREVGSGGDPIRGRLRGAYWCLQNQPLTAPFPGVDVTGVVGLEGRTMRVVMTSTPAGENTGRIGFDITGPWD